MKLIIISLPIISSISILTVGRKIGNKGSKWIGMISMNIITIISSYILIEYLKGKEVILISNSSSWITSNTFLTLLIGKIINNKEGEIIIENRRGWLDLNGIELRIDWLFDRYSIWMVWLVSIFTTIILYYAYWYLEEEEEIIRFIGLFLLFASAMNILILSANILILFIGWELVGVMSFWLIQYWNNSISNIKSSFKAIFFNKIGDLSLIFSLLFLTFKGHTLDFQSNSLNLSNIEQKLLFFTFFLSSIIKSAQFLFHPWLSDAMAGPTPVSALLHAATMVTAGIYLWLKIEGIGFHNNFLISLLIIGSITLIFTGLSSSYSFDFKRLIAFSTASHLSLMFISLLFINGLGSFSFFHLLIHAFFKSLLFLSSGLLIHLFSSFFFLSPSQDTRIFSNLGIISPYYSLLLLISSLSLIGFPSLSGFYSKDKLLNTSFFLSFISNLFSNSFFSFFFFLLLFGGFLSIFYSYKFYSLTYSLPSSSLFNPSLSYSFLSNIGYYSIGTTFFSFFFFFSIFFGSSFSSSFLSPLSSFFSLEVLLPSSLFYFRSLGFYLILSFFFLLLLYLLLSFLSNSSFFSLPLFLNKLSIIFTNRFFIDSLLTYFFFLPTFSSSYFFFFKSLDRGLLEFFGPLGFSRLLSSLLPILVKDNINNYNYSLIIQWFFSSFLFLILLLSLLLFSNF